MVVRDLSQLDNIRCGGSSHGGYGVDDCCPPDIHRPPQRFFRLPCLRRIIVLHQRAGMTRNVQPSGLPGRS